MVWLAREPQIGGGFDTAHRQEIDRTHRLLKRCSRFDFDNKYDIAAPGDKIDLPEFCAIAAANNAIAFQHQCDGSKTFGRVTAAVSLMALAWLGHFIASNR